MKRNSFWDYINWQKSLTEIELWLHLFRVILQRYCYTFNLGPVLPNLQHEIISSSDVCRDTCDPCMSLRSPVGQMYLLIVSNDHLCPFYMWCSVVFDSLRHSFIPTGRRKSFSPTQEMLFYIWRLFKKHLISLCLKYFICSVVYLLHLGNQLGFNC